MLPVRRGLRLGQSISCLCRVSSTSSVPLASTESSTLPACQRPHFAPSEEAVYCSESTERARSALTRYAAASVAAAASAVALANRGARSQTAHCDSDGDDAENTLESSLLGGEVRTSANNDAVAMGDADAVDALLLQLRERRELPMAARSGAPRALVSALRPLANEPTSAKSPEESSLQVLNVLEAIAILSEKRAAAQEFGDAGTVELLTAVLRRTGWAPARRDGFLALVRQTLRLSSASEPAPDSEAPGEATSAQRLSTQYAVTSIANIAKHMRKMDVLLNSDAMALVTSVLAGSRNVESCRQAILALACLANDPASKMLDSPAMELLIKTTAEGETISQWYATGAVRNLLKDSQNHRQAVLLGVIPALVGAAETRGNTQAQALAASALGELATSNYKRAEIIRLRMLDVDAFRVLAKLLRTPSEKVVRSTSRVIDSVLQSVPRKDRAYARIIAAFEEEDVPLLITRLANAKSAPVCTAAIGTLYTIAGLDGLSDQALEAGAARIIIASCNSLDVGIAARALDALACMSEKISRQQHLLKASVLGMILALRSTNPMITQPQMTTVANLARSDEVRAEIAHEGALPLINAMLQSGNINTETKQEALRALYNLAIGGISRLMVVQGGSLPRVIAMVRSPDPLMQALAVGTLSNLLENLEHTMKAFELGALEPLLAVIPNGGDAGRRAVLCVGEMTNLQELHVDLVKRGAVEALAEVVKSGTDAEATAYAVQALCNLAASEVARERLRRSGAVGYLSSMAKCDISCGIASVSTSSYSGHIAAIAAAGLANLQKGGRTMTQVVPAMPSTPL